MTQIERATARAARDVQAAEDRPLVTAATLRAADILGLRRGELAAVLGLSPRSIDRMRQGGYGLHPDRKEWELALLLIRLFRSLHAVCAGDEAVVRQWMANPNADLEAVPKDCIRNVSGLVSVLAYVDSQRAAA